MTKVKNTGLQHSLRAALVLIACLLLASCQQQAAKSATTANAASAVQELPSPAGPESGEPELSAHGGRLILSWVEKITDRHALRFSSFAAGAWSEPRTVAEGANWFVNWADFPSVMARPDGSLVAHWLVMSSGGKYSYDVNLAQSADGGATWSRALVPHRDRTQTEHGFVSLLPWSGGRAAAVWLDGRKFQSQKASAGHDGHGPSSAEMSLRFAAVDARGALSDEVELDGRVCECCQTSAALTNDGAVVVYRDRSKDEMRDISIVRFRDGKWSQPQTLHADGWQIHGCPVNGPSVAADGMRVAVAWFTGAGDRPLVKAALSTDGGTTFGAPVLISDSKPLGRVDVVVLADGSALVSWLEGSEQNATIKARRVRTSGTLDAPFVVRETSAARKSGFPRMARAGDSVIFAWTEIAKPGSPARVRTAMMTLPR